MKPITKHYKPKKPRKKLLAVCRDCGARQPKHRTDWLCIYCGRVICASWFTVEGEKQ